jgi:hypothetical protein
VTKEEYTRITHRMRARLEQAEKTLKESFEQQVKVEAEKARREASRAAEGQIKAALASQEKIVKQRLQAQQATLEKAKSVAVNAEKEKHFREKLKLEEQLQEMQRRLQKKSANELGDEGELDLFSQIKNEFPNDQIERVKKGKQGGDIIHRIIQNGQICGKILYEVKNTSRFMSKYLTILRANQLREQADHGLLITQAFPGESRQVALRENLIIAHPARAVVVASILRRQVIQVHALRLGREGREQKAEAVYSFLISPRAAQLWDEITDATNELEALDNSEKISHEKVWRRRGEVNDKLKDARHSFAEAIDRVIGTTGSEASS